MLDTGHWPLEMGAVNWQNGSLADKKKFAWENKLGVEPKNLNPLRFRSKGKTMQLSCPAGLKTIFWGFILKVCAGMFWALLGTSSI